MVPLEIPIPFDCQLSGRARPQKAVAATRAGTLLDLQVVSRSAGYTPTSDQQTLANTLHTFEGRPIGISTYRRLEFGANVFCHL